MDKSKLDKYKQKISDEEIAKKIKRDADLRKALETRRANEELPGNDR